MATAGTAGPAGIVQSARSVEAAEPGLDPLDEAGETGGLLRPEPDPPAPRRLVHLGRGAHRGPSGPMRRSVTAAPRA